ncbi:unnamed protein product [Orchesella dallaii]|uniref:Uncharacterized protein n=1 Tax=Orchesella dallaii TaxID=48710 RepID=A0ABP1QCN0_9HEXA
MSRLRSESSLPIASRRSTRIKSQCLVNATTAAIGEGHRLSKQESDFVCSFIKGEHAVYEEEAVHQMLGKIAEYVASNSKFFSSTTFESNLKRLSEALNQIHTEKIAYWKKTMYTAMQNQNLDEIRTLVRVNGFDLDSKLVPVVQGEVDTAAKEHTALTWTALKGNVMLLKSLIDEGANPNGMTADGLAPIHFASMDSAGLPALKFLLSHPRLKVDVNSCDTTRKAITPLMSACARGQLSTAEYLIHQNADVNQQDAEGKSALFYAVLGGHIGLIKLLVAHDACVYLRDETNASVLHHLMDAQIHWDVMEEILEYLVGEKGLSVNYKQKNGNTALHMALRRGISGGAQYLINRNAELEAKRNGWETPLWSLIQGKLPTRPMVRMMLNAGANFNAKNALGMSLMYYTKSCLKNTRLYFSLHEVHQELKTLHFKQMKIKRKNIWTETEAVGTEENKSYKPAESKNAMMTTAIPKSADQVDPLVINIDEDMNTTISSDSSSDGTASDSSYSISNSSESDDDCDGNTVNKSDAVTASVAYAGEVTTAYPPINSTSSATTSKETVIRRSSGIEDVSSETDEDAEPDTTIDSENAKRANANSSAETDEQKEIPGNASSLVDQGNDGETSEKDYTNVDERVLRPRKKRKADNMEADNKQGPPDLKLLTKKQLMSFYFSDSDSE